LSTPQPPNLPTTTAALAVGSVALLMLGLQPLLLGALADESRLTLDEIGYAATAELLALGATTGLLAAFMPPLRIRLINAAGGGALALANIASITSHGYGMVAARAAAGTAGGILVWIAIAAITRAARPDRLSGIFLMAQTLAQAALAAILPITLMPRYGANGGLASLAFFGVLAMAASFILPDSFPRLPKPEAGQAGLPIRGLIGLASVFFYLAGIVGLWVFVEQIGTGAKIAASIVGFAVAAALAAQVTGSGIATLITGRIKPVPVLVLCCLLNIAIIVVLSGKLSAPLYLASIILFGFLWLFAMPFQTRLLVDLDPTRRTAMLLSAAQLLGSAAGPLVTSAFATDKTLNSALEADAACFAAGTLLILSLYRRKR
jgi:hypothetical protein